MNDAVHAISACRYLHASPFSNVNLVVTCPEPLPLPVLRKSGVQALYVGKAAKKELPRIPEDGDFAKMVFCLSINAGTFYMRNVAPNGPIAWMMAEVADRQLRWAEGLEEFQKQHPEQTNFHHLFWYVYGHTSAFWPYIGVLMCACCTSALVLGCSSRAHLTHLTTCGAIVSLLRPCLHARVRDNTT